MTNYVWCNTYNEDTPVIDYFKYNITIDPTEEETIVGERVVDGYKIAVYTTVSGVNTGYFKVYGHRAGTGLSGEQYGEGFAWTDDNLTQISYIEPGHALSQTLRKELFGFLNLADSPTTYLGYEDHLVIVNEAGTGLEFVSPESLTTSFLELDDAPETPYGYGPNVYKVVTVNSEATGLAFTAPEDLLVEASLIDAEDDSEAAGLGVAVGQIYRNGSVLMIRVA